MLSLGPPVSAEPIDSAPSSAEKIAPDNPQRFDQTPADPVERRIGEIQERTSKIHAGESIRATESTARHNQRRMELASLQEQLDVAVSMPPGSPVRAEQVDQTWFSLRNLVKRLQDDRIQALDALKTAQSDREKINTQDRLNVPGNPSIDAAMDGFIQAHDARVQAVEREIDVTSTLITKAKTLRRTARNASSKAAIQSVEIHRLEDIQAEIVSIPIDLRSSLRQTIEAWWKNPEELSHVQALGGLFLGLMELSFLLVIGMWAHGRIPTWTQRFIRTWVPETDPQDWRRGQGLPSWMVEGDLRSLAPPVSALIQDLLIFSIASAVMVWLREPVPLIGWLALVFAAGACVRGAQSIVSLALITPTENRPGLRVTSPEVRQASLWIIQFFGMLKAIELIVVHLLVVILGADRIAALFSESVQLFMVGLMGITLLRWGDLLRSRVQDGGTDSFIAQWIVQSGDSKITGLLGAILAVAILAGRFVGTFVQGIIEQRGGLAWLGTILARRQLRDAGERDEAPLSTPMRRSIGIGALEALRMDSEIQQIQRYFTSWQQDPRRGLIAITGDRGVGKTILMSSLKDRLHDRWIEASTPIGHTKASDSLRWLASVANLENQSSKEDLILAFKKIPPTLFLLSNLNRLFHRAVGHYDGLDAVLAVMQATGRHHFWVASFHDPAWSFLQGMAHVGHVNVFSQRIRLGALNPADLSQWLESHTRTVGIEPNFDSLLQRKNSGPDHARVLERTERAYWRLLADSSQGNPSVAVRLWMDSLKSSKERPDVVHVSLFTARNSEELDELSDDELFALTALILHDELTVSELHTVLNQTESNVRALCRGLEQRALVRETETGRYKVRLTWLPSVERHLRRRSFMHKE